MRRTLGTLTGLSLIVPLTPAATIAATAAPAAAAVTATTAAPVALTSATAPKPYSRFRISVSYDKRTKRGGKIRYYVKAKNLGPHYANYYYIGGKVPKGVVPRLRWSGPKGTKCTWEGQWFWCWSPYILNVGKTDWLSWTMTLKKGTRGVALAKVGVIAFDVPTGAEDIAKEELKRLGGLKYKYWLKTVKTTIISPSTSGGGGGYTPPPKKWTPPPTNNEESNKKKET